MKNPAVPALLLGLCLTLPAFAGDPLEEFAQIVKLQESAQTEALIAAGEKFLEEHGGTAADELVLFYLGKAYHGQKKYDEAIKVYSDFREKFSESVLTTEVAMQRGEAYRLTEKFAEMLPDFQLALDGYKKANHANAPHAQFHLVQAYQSTGETEKAKAEAELLQKDYPTSSYAKNAANVVAGAKPAVAGAAADPAEKPAGPAVGTAAPEIEFVHLGDDAKKKLSDFRGKVVVIDFWASWCGPCQTPMAKMQTYREKHPEWGDKVELIALSIDNTPDKAVEHMKTRGWDKTYNAWAGEGGFRSPPPVAFSVRGIPSVFVIDAEGKIAATGHPNAIDVPEIIGGLLKGKSDDGIF